MFVYVLQHSREVEDGDEDVKFIGVFSTEDKGQAAIAELRDKPGFSLYPDGFVLDRYELDRLWWTEGFVTITPKRPETDEED